ncbi:MAG: thioredoxin domain-containing protein [Gammaproteobacteria bacterium]|nr:thioredoxin domain-containing protein [Gammaproteobacteria bacterium]
MGLFVVFASMVLLLAPIHSIAADIDVSVTHEQVTYVTTENFTSEVLESNLPVLVDFTATWCAPCKELDPIIDSLLPEMSGSAKVFKLDIDESPEISSQFQLSGVPTVLFFNDGKEKDRIVGPQPRELYIRYLQGMKQGESALEIKIALLEEDSFRRYFIVNQRPEVLREALESTPTLLKENFENGQSPLSLVLNSHVGMQDERIQMVLAENPVFRLGDHVGLGECNEFKRIVSEDPEAVNRPDSDGNTPLLTALIHHGRLKERSCLREVLDAGADPGMKDSSSFTVGRAAVLISNRDFLEELLEKGLDTKHTDVIGRNSLHWAASYSFPPTVKSLLKYGVDPSVRALNGETAADIVRQKRDLWLSVVEGKSSVSEDLKGLLAWHDELLALLEESPMDEE